MREPATIGRGDQEEEEPYAQCLLFGGGGGVSISGDTRHFLWPCYGSFIPILRSLFYEFYGVFMVFLSLFYGFRMTFGHNILFTTTRRVPTVNQKHVGRLSLATRQSLPIMLSKSRFRQPTLSCLRQRNVANSIRVTNIVRVTIRIT